VGFGRFENQVGNPASTGLVGIIGGAPTISRFFGIVITMYFDDQEPAHFHARYSGGQAKVRIHTTRTRRRYAEAPQASVDQSPY